VELNLQQQAEFNIIRSIQSDDNSCRIKIGDSTLSESVILTLDQFEMWKVSKVDDLTVAHFNRLAELPVEVLLLGAGRKIHFPQPHVTQPLISKQIGLEVMDTAAACRTFNILASDGRKVAAALILW